MVRRIIAVISADQTLTAAQGDNIQTTNHTQVNDNLLSQSKALTHPSAD